MDFPELDVWTRLSKEKRPIVMYGTGNGADKLFEIFNLYGIKVMVSVRVSVRGRVRFRVRVRIRVHVRVRVGVRVRVRVRVGVVKIGRASCRERV